MSLGEHIDYFLIFMLKKNQVDTLILRSNNGANVQDAKMASFLCFRHYRPYISYFPPA